MGLDEFIDQIIPVDLIGTGPDDGLPADFRAGSGVAAVEPTLTGGLRTSVTEFE